MEYRYSPTWLSFRDYLKAEDERDRCKFHEGAHVWYAERFGGTLTGCEFHPGGVSFVRFDREFNDEQYARIGVAGLLGEAKGSVPIWSLCQELQTVNLEQLAGDIVNESRQHVNDQDHGFPCIVPLACHRPSTVTSTISVDDVRKIVAMDNAVTLLKDALVYVAKEMNDELVWGQISVRSTQLWNQYYQP